MSGENKGRPVEAAPVLFALRGISAPTVRAFISQIDDRATRLGFRVVRLVCYAAPEGVRGSATLEPIQ